MNKVKNGLSIENFVFEYLSGFKRMLLTGQENREFSERENMLLDLEKETAVLFYRSFVKKHKFSPDMNILESELKKNFLERYGLFREKEVITNETEFIKAHINQIKNDSRMKREMFVADGYRIIIESEEKVALETFKKNEKIPTEYKHLLISHSFEMMNNVLDELYERFNATYIDYYRGFRLKREEE